MPGFSFSSLFLFFFTFLVFPKSFGLFRATPNKVTPMLVPLTLDDRIDKAQHEVKELEAAVRVLPPLRRYLRSLEKIRDGGQPENEDQENTSPVDGGAGVSEDEPRQDLPN